MPPLVPIGKVPVAVRVDGLPWFGADVMYGAIIGVGSVQHVGQTNLGMPPPGPSLPIRSLETVVLHGVSVRVPGPQPPTGHKGSPKRLPQHSGRLPPMVCGPRPPPHPLSSRRQPTHGPAAGILSPRLPGSVPRCGVANLSFNRSHALQVARQVGIAGQSIVDRVGRERSGR